jgi:hypothetical protein
MIFNELITISQMAGLHIPVEALGFFSFSPEWLFEHNQPAMRWVLTTRLRAGLWPSETQSYVKFKRPYQKWNYKFIILTEGNIEK